MGLVVLAVDDNYVFVAANHVHDAVQYKATITGTQPCTLSVCWIRQGRRNLCRERCLVLHIIAAKIAFAAYSWRRYEDFPSVTNRHLFECLRIDDDHVHGLKVARIVETKTWDAGRRVAKGVGMVAFNAHCEILPAQRLCIHTSDCGVR